MSSLVSAIAVSGLLSAIGICVSSAGRERARRIRLHPPLHRPVSLSPLPTLALRQALLSLLSAMLYLVLPSARRYLVYLVRWHALVER